MIEEILLSCGKAPSSTPISFEAKHGVTILVGPNNSGKSALLESLAQTVKGVAKTKPSSLMEAMIEPFSGSDLEIRPEFLGKSMSDIVKIGNFSYAKEDWIKNFGTPANWRGPLGGAYREQNCIWMNGTTRLTMLPDEKNADLLKPVGPLARMFSDDNRRQNFQNLVYDGIFQYPIIDRMSQYGTLRLAFSTEKPAREVERGADAQLLELIEKSIKRDTASDGFNAYVGLIGAIWSNDYKCILIDEPEAFLHPSLARTLGKQISLHAKEKQVFVATHSAEFLMGAIESGAAVRIVRLQYNNGVPTACLLQAEKLQQFMNDPLLRSSNVLSGLFAQSVVVGESDTDRAFYQEINSRLLSQKDPRGIENAVFLNAQNKQTVPRILQLLRNMGVPASGIVDLDVLAEGGKNWTKQLEGAGFPEATHAGHGSTRRAVFDELKAVSTDTANKDYKRRGEIDLLSPSDKEAAQDMLNALLTYGVLVVPHGEVEAWLPQLGAQVAKDRWLHEIFNNLGSDPNSNEYVQPEPGDVWDFIGLANNWHIDPNRRGMND
jgi:energy-coupling factor transporter ATP-binding protein EcfA2